LGSVRADAPDGHEDRIEATDSRVDVAHGRGKGEALAVDLEADHFELVEGDIAVAVTVEDLEGQGRLVTAAEAVGDLVDGQIGAVVRAEGKEDAPGELARLVAG
jgi:hypothetical protein